MRYAERKAAIDSSAKSRKQCLISSRRPVPEKSCTDGGCDLWVSGSSTVWVALFYGLGRMGGKTVRTSWESHEKVIKIIGVFSSAANDEKKARLLW
nr:MAG TPA: hypothetical protein [Caudoviricetes sp.]